MTADTAILFSDDGRPLVTGTMQPERLKEVVAMLFGPEAK